MFIPLQKARLCMDCDAIFEEVRCPRCSSESFFPLSRWVRPAVDSEAAGLRKKAKKASFLLIGSGVAFTLWQLLKKSDSKSPEKDPPK